MKRITILLAGALLLVITTAATSRAVEPDEVLHDPVLEKRARGISTELRCVVCQNQSIDDSDAEIARDLRLLVRERLVAGDSDEQVVDYLVARYGDFILLRPPFQPNTFALWLAPPIMAVIIATLAVLYCRRCRRRQPAGAAPGPLSPVDRAELDALLDRLVAGSGARPPRSRIQNELEGAMRAPDPEDYAEATGDVAEDINGPRDT